MTNNRMGRNPFQAQAAPVVVKVRTKNKDVGLLCYASKQLQALKIYQRFPIVKKFVDHGVIRTLVEAVLPHYSHLS